MKNSFGWMLLRVLAVVAVAACLGSTVQAQPQNIGIKFNDGGPGAHNTGTYPLMDPTEVAGVVPQANWNNAPANFFAFNLGPLTDQNGIAVGATSLTFQGANTWTTEIPDAPGDSRLMGAYLDSNDRNLNVILVTGLSALATSNGTYDVYVYCNGDGTNRHGFYTISNGNLDVSGLGGTTLTCTEFTLFDGMTYMEDIQDGNGGNYIHFRGVSGDALFLLASAQNPNDPNDNGFRAPINAIQIVAN